MFRTEIDVITKEQKRIELTPQEIEEAKIRAKKWEEEQKNINQRTPEEKLKAAGLTVDDLKQLLGL